MDDDGLFYRRQGFWLRMARERAGKSQEGAAVEIGLSKASKSTISDYENAMTEAPQKALRTLARWYDVPVDLFNRPPMTADEVIDQLADRLSRDAAAAERVDWEAERDQAPASDAEADVAPGRRSA